MSTPDVYSEWKADGSPWKLAKPIDELTNVLRKYGYTVYTIGNTSHLTKRACSSCPQGSGAEDHTPYSHTGWPVANHYPYVCACDIMAPSASSKLPSLAQLGAQLHVDRQAGRVSWLKYMNWEPSGSGGPCYHDSWQPNYTRRTSTDRGHIHISVRSDAINTSTNGYDPVARVRGDDMPSVEEIAAAVAARVWGVRVVSPNGKDAYTSNGALNDTVRAARHGVEVQLPALLAGQVAMQGQLAKILGNDFTDEQAIADAVLAKLGGNDVADIAAALRSTMTADKARALGELLAATVDA